MSGPVGELFAVERTVQYILHTVNCDMIYKPIGCYCNNNLEKILSCTIVVTRYNTVVQ